jgi:hypothetical protein
MQAGQVGNFPHLHILVMGFGLRFFEVSAAQGVTPPEVMLSTITTQSKNGRIHLSAKFTLSTKRITMIADVDVAIFACPQAGQWIS